MEHIFVTDHYVNTDSLNTVFLFETYKLNAKLNITLTSSAIMTCNIGRCSRSYVIEKGTIFRATNIDDTDNVKPTCKIYTNPNFTNPLKWERILVTPGKPEDTIRVILKPRSLYIIKTDARSLPSPPDHYLLKFKWTEEF